jgi:hypothetical protein
MQLSVFSCDMAGNDVQLQDYLVDQLGNCRTDLMKKVMEKQPKSTQEEVRAGEMVSLPVRDLSTNPHRTKRKTSPVKKGEAKRGKNTNSAWV